MGVNDELLKESFTIYPKVIKKEKLVIIEFSNEDASTKQITIIDATGRLIQKLESNLLKLSISA